MTAATIRDVRSVMGAPLLLPLGPRVTVLVGPNRAGSSALLFALAAAFDPHVPFVVDRDLPREGGRQPRVRLSTAADPAACTVSWDPHRGTRALTGDDFGGHAVLAEVQDTPRDLVRRADAAAGVDGDGMVRRPVRQRLARAIRDTAQEVLADVEEVEVDGDGTVVVRDAHGWALAVPETRALAALGLARFLAAEGRPPALVGIASPEAFLHPAAQELIARSLVEVATETGAPVVIATSSPFVIPRLASVTVVGLARDERGRTDVVGTAPGDGPQSHLLGGLLRDAGLASVLDRVGRIPADTRAVLVVEGGTDEAYLRTVARVLGRPEVLDGVAIVPSGGAMGVALAAIVLRAELDRPVLALLDHDDPGRRARDTLVSRFGFDRGREVVMYADVFDGVPPGIVAESLFDLELMRRFVRAHGRAAASGERREGGVVTVDLTSSGKSAFVGWVANNARRTHLERWDGLLDLLDERLPPRARD